MADYVGVIQQKQGPTYVEWNIEDYFSYTEVEFLESPNFSISDETKWWLELYPHGDEGSGEYVSLFLSKGPSYKEYDLAFKFGIMKSDDSVFESVEFKYKFAGDEPGYGCPEFVLRSDLLKAKDTLSRDGVLRVFCDIRFVDTTVMDASCGTRSPKSLEILIQNYMDLYLDRRLSDVAVTVKDKVFQTHKAILAARSPVFAAMFEHDTLERSTSTVTITDCDPNSFKEFLLFLYTGKVEEVSPSNVFGLYETANKYDVKELREECVKLMELNLSVNTFSDTAEVAANYNECELLKHATEYFIKNVKQIIPTAKWQVFMARNPDTANNLLMELFQIKPAKAKKGFKKKM